MDADEEDAAAERAGRAPDDDVCRVQDAFFEGRYGECEGLALHVLRSWPRDEDVYDALLASLLAQERYGDVVERSVEWVRSCGESLRQLLHCLEAAYMLGDMEVVEEVAFKLCFLFESSGHDPVFAPGALLAAALSADFELPFPGCLAPDDLLRGDVLSEPVAWWLTRRLGRPAYAFDAGGHEQAADLARCLRAFDKGEDAAALLGPHAAVDATGLAARHLLLGAPLPSSFSRTRVHPLVRKRLAERDEA